MRSNQIFVMSLKIDYSTLFIWNSSLTLKSDYTTEEIRLPKPWVFPKKCKVVADFCWHFWKIIHACCSKGYGFFLTREFREAILFLLVLHHFAFVWETVAENLHIRWKIFKRELPSEEKNKKWKFQNIEIDVFSLIEMA